MAVLTNLTLMHNSIGSNGAKAIAEALKVNAVVTTLDLTVCCNASRSTRRGIIILYSIIIDIPYNMNIEPIYEHAMRSP